MSGDETLHIDVRQARPLLHLLFLPLQLVLLQLQLLLLLHQRLPHHLQLFLLFIHLLSFFLGLSFYFQLLPLQLGVFFLLPPHIFCSPLLFFKSCCILRVFFIQLLKILWQNIVTRWEITWSSFSNSLTLDSRCSCQLSTCDHCVDSRLS